MGNITVDKSLSLSLEQWADKQAQASQTRPSAVPYRLAQGLTPLLAVIETVIRIAVLVLMLPVTIAFGCCSPKVREANMMLLKALAESAYAIIAPYKQAITSCCCAAKPMKQVPFLHQPFDSASVVPATPQDFERVEQMADAEAALRRDLVRDLTSPSGSINFLSGMVLDMTKKQENIIIQGCEGRVLSWDPTTQKFTGEGNLSTGKPDSWIRAAVQAEDPQDSPEGSLYWFNEHTGESEWNITVIPAAPFSVASAYMLDPEQEPALSLESFPEALVAADSSSEVSTENLRQGDKVKVNPPSDKPSQQDPNEVFTVESIQGEDVTLKSTTGDTIWYHYVQNVANPYWHSPTHNKSFWNLPLIRA